MRIGLLLRWVRRHGGAVVVWSLWVGLGVLLAALWWGIFLWQQESWRREWEKMRLQVFLKPEAESAVREVLRRFPAVREIEVISPAQGWEQLRQALGLPDWAGIDTLLPSVCSVRLHPTEWESLSHVRQQLLQHDGVLGVEVPEESLRGLLRRGGLHRLIWGSVGAVLALVWLALFLASTLSLRRVLQQYEVLVLLGLSPGRLRGGLVTVLVFFGLVATLVGVAAAVGIGRWVPVGEVSEPFRIAFLALGWWGGTSLAVLCALVGTPPRV